MDATPLIVTSDPDLRDALARLAAAAGVAPEVAPAAEAHGRWVRAPAVVVGADQAAALARLDPPRRDGVLVGCLGAAEGDAIGCAPAEDSSVLRAALALGAERVLTLPRDEAAVVAALSDLGEPDRRAPVLAVTGGSGGAGASVLAAALAARGARGGPSLLVDLDPLGPGSGRLLGLGGSMGWPDLSRGAGRLGAAALRDAVPRTVDGVGVLGWPDVPGAPGSVDEATVREALAAAVRGHAAVVVDLPRGAGHGWAEVLPLPRAWCWSRARL